MNGELTVKLDTKDFMKEMTRMGLSADKAADVWLSLRNSDQYNALTDSEQKLYSTLTARLCFEADLVGFCESATKDETQ